MRNSIKFYDKRIFCGNFMFQINAGVLKKSNSSSWFMIFQFHNKVPFFCKCKSRTKKIVITDDLYSKAPPPQKKNMKKKRL